MILNLGCICEGHGEVQAVPLLLRRIQQELDPTLDLRIPPLVRIGRQKLVKPGELEGTVEQWARRLQPPRAILILIDADDDCPARLGPALLERAEQARPDVPLGLVLAKREFEAWFLAAIESLRGKRGVAENCPAVPEPESIRGAKEELGRCMGAYSPTIDQPALAAIFDMQCARERSDSFDKCWREVERLFRRATENYPT